MKIIQTPLSKLKSSLKVPVLVTGAHGMLGWELVRQFRYYLGDNDVIATDVEELDITNPEWVNKTLDELKPRLLLNAAAYTNVDGAEKDREQAHSINVIGPSVLAEACARRKIVLVHFGTDQVFDGTARSPRKENDPVSPSNHYASTKLLGEQEVLKAENSLVVRIQWLYGERKDRFTPLRFREEFTPFSDQWGAPTWTKDLAEIVIELLASGQKGLFHFSYDDYATWAEVFDFVKTELQLRVKLFPKKTCEFSLPAKRPQFSVLSNKKLLEALGRESLGSWRDSLREFLTYFVTGP